MKKIIGISTSLNKDSNSRNLLMNIENIFASEYKFQHISLLDGKYRNIYCDACGSCKESNKCIKELNQSILDIIQDSDIIIFAFPIYYGCISGKSKSLLEIMYPFRNNELKGKKVIVLLSASKPEQEGIAVIELLPWCFKHGSLLKQVETINDLTTNEEKIELIERVKTTIKDTSKKDLQMHIKFEQLKYLNNEVGIPIEYDIKMSTKV